MTPTATADVAGRKLPVEWQIAIPSRSFSIACKPLNPRAWIGTGFSYWEGPLSFAGSHDGVGYLELTGYCSAVCSKGPAMYHLTALITLLAIAFYFFFVFFVSRSRTLTGVKVPEMSGHPDFERAFRIQMNTLEWMPIVLPALWLFAVYIGDAAAAGLGAVWIIGRVVYFVGYSKAAAKRGPGFMIQGVAAMALRVGALAAKVLRLV